eukprot:2989185-Rhodomonas_salina.1
MHLSVVVSSSPSSSQKKATKASTSDCASTWSGILRTSMLAARTSHAPCFAALRKRNAQKPSSVTIK